MEHNNESIKKMVSNPFNSRINNMITEFDHIKEKEPERAFEIIKEASNCGNIYAQLKYCKFLRTTPNLHIEQFARYHEAERLLLGLFNLLDIPQTFCVDVALELAVLYSEYLHRPVGALGMYLYARRLGGTIDEYNLQYLKKKMMKSDIRLLGKNYRDSLLLGQELRHAGGMTRLAEFFLREAVDGAYTAIDRKENGAVLTYAQAALTLGDFYDTQIDNNMIIRTERDKLYAVAKAYGYPEYLRKEK